jgi:cytochrome c oxidase subunit 2
MPSAVRLRSLVLVVAVLAALAFADLALAANGGFTPPHGNSPNADRINHIYYLILGVTGAIFVLVEGLLLLFVFRFRSRGRPRSVEGAQIRGHHRLELIWTAIPVVIVVAIFSFVFYKLPGIQNAEAGAGQPLRLRVVGHQFYWQFEYPNGAIAIDELRVPQGRTVDLDITSPDVNHSWWIPELGGKFDAIPGQVTHTWFRAEQTGTYRGQCAELCGIQHAVMYAHVLVMPPDEFDAWYAAAGEAQPQLGRDVFTGACAKCHGISGQGLIGPSLQGNGTIADRRGLETLLREGRNEMPPVGQDWSDRQMDATIDYLQQRFAEGGSGGSQS